MKENVRLSVNAKKMSFAHLHRKTPNVKEIKEKLRFHPLLTGLEEVASTLITDCCRQFPVGNATCHKSKGRLDRKDLMCLV